MPSPLCLKQIQDQAKVPVWATANTDPQNFQVFAEVIFKYSQSSSSINFNFSGEKCDELPLCRRRRHLRCLFLLRNADKVTKFTGPAAIPQPQIKMTFNKVMGHATISKTISQGLKELCKKLT